MDFLKKILGRIDVGVCYTRGAGLGDGAGGGKGGGVGGRG